jgi:hypothetical protein
MVRFPIRFDRWYAALSAAVFLPPAKAYVAVGAGAVDVRMGWAFRSRFPRSAVVGVSPLAGRPFSRGVHGLFGRWLVNGSGDRVVAIDLDPPQRARVTGFPVRLRRLMVSVDDPRGLATALGR